MRRDEELDQDVGVEGEGARAHPLGTAVKEHGSHLPFLNDEVPADSFARRVVEARPVALLPTMTYGFSPAFLEHPGSVSLALRR